MSTAHRRAGRALLTETVIAGFTSRHLTERVAALLSASSTSKQPSHDVRRGGLHAPRYDLTPAGQHVALLFTKTYGASS